MEASIPFTELSKENKPSKVNDLFSKIMDEIDRQGNVITSLEKSVAPVLSPPSPMSMREAEKNDTVDSEVVSNLRAILDSVINNTHAISGIHDRIEL